MTHFRLYADEEAFTIPCQREQTSMNVFPSSGWMLRRAVGVECPSRVETLSVRSRPSPDHDACNHGTQHPRSQV